MRKYVRRTVNLIVGRIVFPVFLMMFACVNILSGCASKREGEAPDQYADDLTITGRVKNAITRDPLLKTFQINVETQSGIVQLSGFVDAAHTARKAGEVASDVDGVASVKNDLIVQ